MEHIKKLVQSLRFQAERKAGVRVDLPPRSVSSRIEPMSFYKLDQLAAELGVTRSSLVGDLVEAAIEMAYFEAFSEEDPDHGRIVVQPSPEKVIEYFRVRDEANAEEPVSA